MANFIQFYTRLFAWGVVIPNPPTPITSTSRLDCTMLCISNSTCSSFYFNKQDSACYLHNRWVQGLVTANPPTETHYFVLYSSVCWYPGYEYLRAADICINISYAKADWWIADDNCQLDGARLVKIDNSAKMTNMMSLLKTDYPDVIYFWIDGNDASVEGSWKWMDGSHVIIYFWAAPEPNDSGDCLSIGIWDGWDGWDDYTCSEVELYICERK